MKFKKMRPIGRRSAFRRRSLADRLLELSSVGFLICMGIFLTELDNIEVKNINVVHAQELDSNSYEPIKEYEPIKPIEFPTLLDSVNSPSVFETTAPLPENRMDLTFYTGIETVEVVTVDSPTVENIPEEPIAKVEVHTITYAKPITINYNDISEISNASVDYINLAVKDTWLENYGWLYHKLENEYRVNAFLAIATSIQETGWEGNSMLALEDNNIFGLTDKKFDTIEDCIHYYFELIATHYVGEGYISMDQINKKYCPPDSTWATDIYAIANKLNSKAKSTMP